MPAAQLEFAGFFPTVAAVPAAVLPSQSLLNGFLVGQTDKVPAAKRTRILYLDEESRPKRKRKKKEPTPAQQRKRDARARRRRDRSATQWVKCCTRLYHRTRACHTWWGTCHACKQPLTWPSWQP